MALLRRKTKLRARKSKARLNASESPDITAFGREGTVSRTRRLPETPNSSQRPEGQTSFVTYWLQRLGLLILLFVATIAIVNVLALSTNPQVLPLDGASKESAFLRDTTVYHAKAQQLLKESIFNQNKVTINTSHISRQMEQSFPELASVSITLPLAAHRPIVYIEPAKPALILVAANGTFVVDTRGRALLDNAQNQIGELKHLPVVNDQSGLKVRVNKQAIPSDDVVFMLTVIHELKAKNMEVASITLPPASSELDVSIKNQPYFVKFNLQSGDARKQAGTYLATVNKLKQQNSVPVQYIDVRVPGRAYYQ